MSLEFLNKTEEFKFVLNLIFCSCSGSFLFYCCVEFSNWLSDKLSEIKRKKEKNQRKKRRKNDS